MNLEDFKELHGLFRLAEEKLKLVEHLDSVGSLMNLDTVGLCIPSNNQLRYAGKHILLALTSDSEEEYSQNILKAKDHCERAIFDAMEMGVVVLLDNIGRFGEDFRNVTIAKVIPDYIQDLRKIKDIRTFVSKNNRMDGTKDGYKTIQKHFESAKEILEKFDLSRSELNKERRRLLMWVTVSIVTIVIGLLALLL